MISKTIFMKTKIAFFLVLTLFGVLAHAAPLTVPTLEILKT